jgi:hypothetical protein
MTRRALPVLTLVAAALAGASPSATASPAPSVVDFPTVKKASANVFIGVLHPTSFVVDADVEAPLRGGFTKGSRTLQRPKDPAPTLPADQRVVVFVDGEDRVRWVAELLGGTSLEDGVLGLEGVAPGVVTLDWLKRAFKGDGKLGASYEASLFGRRARTFTVDVDEGGAVHDRGLAIPCLAAIELDAAPSGVTLDLEGACKGKTRRALLLHGQYSGIDPATGAIRVDVLPSTPALHEDEIDAYAADPSIVDVVRSVGVALSDGTTWIWRAAAQLEDPHGVTHGTLREYGTPPSASVFSFDGGTLSLVPATDDPAADAADKKIRRCLMIRPGHPDTACKLAPRPTVFVRR